MDTKEELVKHIRNWIQIDNDIASLQKQAKVLREEKKNLTSSLVDVMKSNEIDCFEIGHGSSLVYTKHKSKKALSKKHLLNSLATYFKGNTNQAKELSKFIMNSREENITENIRRKVPK